MDGIPGVAHHLRKARLGWINRRSGPKDYNFHPWFGLLNIVSHRASAMKILNGNAPIRNRERQGLVMGVLRMASEIVNQAASTSAASATPDQFHL